MDLTSDFNKESEKRKQFIHGNVYAIWGNLKISGNVL